ncbi:MAG TPA: ribosome recycling factor [Gammaproteobacteria bacterium]|nr:ribosome recycling factor [Gammaproteobacteria bacterium]|tara:strand:+ start:743 stop:1300 length:558 start_codon:yes stop_codon:yes gene_type:complete
MIKDILADAGIRMGKSIDAFRLDLTKIRTGRAHPSLLDHVMVDYYGAQTPLTQAANVAVEDARTLTVTAWDKTMVPVIEKAILESDLGLNPATMGTVMRIPLPPLSEERRRDLIKVTKSEAENSRIAVRNIRRDAIHRMKELAKNKEISADDEHKGEDQVQKLTDSKIKEIDSILSDKESEMLEV